jgi:hypothetical protein
MFLSSSEDTIIEIYHYRPLVERGTFMRTKLSLGGCGVPLSSSKEKSRPRLKQGRLSGELLGLACSVCSLKQENDWTRISTISDYQSRGLGRSHLTVIRTHTFFNHLLSSVT